MWPYYPELLATPVPRYTSYPTAAEFRPLQAEDHRRALSEAHGDISLYVHIPFCEKICFYCGCNTGKAGKRQRLNSYLDALFCEAELISSLLPGDAAVKRIAFGGGSPNAIDPTEFLRLLGHLTECFAAAEPVLSIELDPRTLSADWAAAIGTARVDRASLGVQTFAPHCQAAIGRVQSEAVIEQGVSRLRSNGVTSLNFDLMYGLPAQSCEDLLDSLQRSVRLGADRIALFGYAHVPDIVPRQRVIDADALPGSSERFAMAELGHAFLTSRGYVSVGFDHFAKPDDPLARANSDGLLRRNFQGFTDDQSGVLIGLGSSAISSFPSLLVQNQKNSGRYRMLASQHQLATDLGIPRDSDDRQHARLVEDLLCLRAATLPDDPPSHAIDALAAFIERDLVKLDGARLAVLPAGVPYARTIAALFDSYRPGSARKFSAAV